MNMRWTFATRLAAVVVTGLLLSTAGVAAQDELAAAGNGGTGTGSAIGGAATVGDVMSGGNVGNALGLGDTGGGEISGGAVANSTDGTIDVDGGIGIGDASGGEDNIAFTYDPAPRPENDAPEEDEFEVCLTINNEGPVCGPGSCENSGEGLICEPAQSTCDRFDIDRGDCFFGGSGRGECDRASSDRAKCTVLD